LEDVFFVLQTTLSGGYLISTKTYSSRNFLFIELFLPKVFLFSNTGVLTIAFSSLDFNDAFK